MSKQTIKGQQQIINSERRIIESLSYYYKSCEMPEYEKMYIKDLEKKIAERKAWINQQQ